MPPTTRSKGLTTPTRPSRPGDYDTPTKSRFYAKLVEQYPSRSINAISRDFAPSTPTGKRWAREWRELGSPALRRLRPQSEHAGRPSKITKEACKMLCSPSRNPVRDQQFEAQIEYHKLPIQKRQLQRKLKELTNKAQRYKQAYISKTVSQNNLKERENYGLRWRGKSIEEHWQWLIFTDEAHIDPTSQAQGNILREQGTREDSENIQERGELRGCRVHVAGWVNWHFKCEKLEFYNDEQDQIIRPERPPKPRTRKYESKEESTLR